MSLRMSPRKQIDRIAGNRHRLCTKRPTGLESLVTVADLADYGWCKCGAHSVHSEVIYVGVAPNSAGGSNIAKSCPAEGFRTDRFVRQVDESSPEVIGAECPSLSDSPLANRGRRGDRSPAQLSPVQIRKEGMLHCPRILDETNPSFRGLI